MNLNDYIKSLIAKYGIDNISFTGYPIGTSWPITDEEELDDIEVMGKIFGEQIGKLNHKIECLQEDINILYGLLNEKKRKNQVRPRSISKSKGKGKV
jgi:hypothetical protein